jgi:2-C-methyl-D-erythritol 4-phosphate cytidylyltransferase/2-C-methyl-D-erythritol 2,4-cyclodiphosphate synthase
MQTAPTIALIVAAGRGSRFGATAPKQYVDLAGKTVLRHSLETFTLHPRIDAVRVVIHGDDRAMYDAATVGLDLLEPVTGGATRQESVHRGLISLENIAPKAVLIHDAARPLVSAGLIDRMLDALETAPGAIPALPVADTLKRGSNGRVQETLDRATL